LAQVQGGKSALKDASAPKGFVLQRFVLVVEGTLMVHAGTLDLELQTNHFLFCPDNRSCELASDDAKLLVYERSVLSEVAQKQQIQHGFVEDSPLQDTGAPLLLRRPPRKGCKIMKFW
jgi:glyoxylate utilization-related uncharacterized protein